MDETAAWATELEEMGFTYAQIGYMIMAQIHVKLGYAKTVEELQEHKGYGVVDEAVLRDTFFKEPA